MDALKLLTADHNRVRGLFAQFKEAEEKDDTPTMDNIATRIIRELEVHTSIEESVFYPKIKEASTEVSDLVAEGFEEHGVVKTLIPEVQAETPGEETWVAKMKVIIENVEHHADEEEKEMFPKVRKAMKTSLDSLGEQLEKAKMKLGAPTMADTIDLTTSELEKMASAQKIPGRSKMSHEELAASVDPTA